MDKPSIKLFLNLVLLCCVIFGTIETNAQSYFPAKNEDWKRQSPEIYGINATLLSEALLYAESNEYTGSRDLRQAILKGFEREPFHEILGPTKKRGGPAGMILKKGYIIAQWGDVDRVDMTFSVTKSYLSTVAGLAIDRGIISDVHTKVGNYVWDGTFRGAHNQKVTWDHLLTQSSDWTGSLFGVKDWADRPPREGGIDDWKMRSFHEPGTVMDYNDVRVNVLAYALLQVFRKPLPMVLKDEIMDPIGASDTWRWYGYDHSWVNVDGIKMQSVSGGGHSGGGVFINTKDQARFGLLFMNKGKWDTKQLISEEWIKMAISSSQTNPNYGYMWWLNQEGNRHMEDIPNHVFYAAGFGGNYIIIDQENELVIVTRWLEPSKMKSFLQLVYAALPE